MLVKFDEFGALEITDAAVLNVVAGAASGLPPPPQNLVCPGPLVDFVLAVERYALNTAAGVINYAEDYLGEVNVYCPT